MDYFFMVISGATVSLLGIGAAVAAKSPVGLLVVGIVAIIAGVLSIVFRRKIRDFVVRAQSRSFGSAVGKRMESTRPWAFAVAGTIFVCMGAVCLILLFI
jgi:drug/metabolite transporter (DMT)-like permease